MRITLALLALFAALLVPGASFARCRPSPGDQLVLLAPRATGGIVLLQRRPAFSEGDVLTGETPTTLALRRTGCTRGCTSSVALRALAPNLYAFTMPASSPAGTYEITSRAAGGRFENAPSATPPGHAIGGAPASVSIDAQLVGTGMSAPMITLGAPAPAEAIGLLARWQGSSLFMPIGSDRLRFLLFAGRCRAPLPGFSEPTIGTSIELTFVDAAGRLSPSTHLALPAGSPSAR